MFGIGEFHKVMSTCTVGDLALNSAGNYLTVDMEPLVIFLLVSASILNHGEK